MDIREHLQADLMTVHPVDGVGTKVYAGRRPQATALPCLVWRCTKATRGETLTEDSGERVAHFEIVIWAASLQACLAIKETLEDRYHGTEGYDFGGVDNVAPTADVPPLDMGSSRLIDEYDGDRVSDTYDDGGAFPLTLVFEFQWDE